jgi:hypothetical protein
MKIKFSRHAKRRAKLYNISEKTIHDVLVGMNLKEGENEIVKHIDQCEYPLKIIVSVKKDTVTVITNYPLKKGRTK